MQRLTASSHPWREVADGVVRLGIGFVNVYALGEPDGRWVLVDTGVPKTAARVVEACRRRFGAGSAPRAIWLTHGHFDHVGNALELARLWDIPIYAHPLEVPYLSGESDYPPKDPTVGGAVAFLARTFPDHGYDVGDYLEELPDDGWVPGLPGWKWVHTPGHSPGHVSFFRSSDGVLVAGDAVATMDADSWVEQIRRRPTLARPPAPFTCDWRAARESITRLARLGPRVLAAGHGVPIRDTNLAGKLRNLADQLPVPSHGRYAQHPAKTDRHGVVDVPPPVADRPMQRLAVAGFGLAVGVASAWFGHRLRNAQKEKR